MKKFSTFIIIMSFLVPGVALSAHAQNDTVSDAALIETSSAGTLPSSPWFVFDRLGENISLWFTANKSDKARLRLEIASERISEVEAMLAKKEKSARGINRAEAIIVRNLNKAALDLESENEDVTDVAEELHEKLEKQKKKLFDVLRTAEQELWAERKVLLSELRSRPAAEQAELGDTITALENRINGFSRMSDELEVKINDDHARIRVKTKDDIRKTHDRADNALRQIFSARKEQLKATARIDREEFDGEDVVAARSLFASGQDVLREANVAYEIEDFDLAERLAKEARRWFNDARSGRNFSDSDDADAEDEKKDKEKDKEDDSDEDDDLDDGEGSDDSDDDAEDDDVDDNTDDDINDGSDSSAQAAEKELADAREDRVDAGERLVRQQGRGVDITTAQSLFDEAVRHLELAESTFTDEMYIEARGHALEASALFDRSRDAAED